MSVKIDGLAAAVAEELKAYSEEVMSDLKKEVREVAKECVKEIQANSPKDTGDYQKGWKVRTAFESNDDIRLTVHNKDHYQRTHLLENGHANVDGSRTPGIPHIAPAADNAAMKLEERAKVICHETS